MPFGTRSFRYSFCFFVNVPVAGVISSTGVFGPSAVAAGADAPGADGSSVGGAAGSVAGVPDGPGAVSYTHL